MLRGTKFRAVSGLGFRARFVIPLLNPKPRQNPQCLMATVSPAAPVKLYPVYVSYISQSLPAVLLKPESTTIVQISLPLSVLGGGGKKRKKKNVPHASHGFHVGCTGLGGHTKAFRFGDRRAQS